MESGEHSDTVDVDDPKLANGNAASKEGDSSSDGQTADQNVTYASKPGEILRNLQNVLYIYRQDVVKSKKNGKIGIVTEVAGDSDSDSSITDDEDEDEDDEDEKHYEVGSDEEVKTENHENIDKNAVENADESEYKNGPLTADQVRVLWMDESETTENTKDVTVIDRGFLHGDYVAAASDPTGQIGLVVDVNITVDLLAHDGSVLKDLPSKGLKRIREFTVGDHVVLGPWLGRIEDVFDNVTVLLDDGSVCKVMKADPLRLKPVGKNILEDGHFPYYPGQRVKASSSSVFKNSRWLSGLWKANRLEGTVTKVTVGSVFIYWIASAGYGPDSATTPAEEQSPKNLKLLSCFAHSNWQLGDWCLYPSSPETLMDKGISKSESRDHAKGEPESVVESDAEVTAAEELTDDNKLVEKDSEDSLNRITQALDNGGPAESSLCSSSVSTSKEAAQLHRKKIRKVVVRKEKKTRKKVENFEQALSIINTKTKVDVAWQDGTIQRGVDSVSLISIDTPGDHEFVSEQYVVEKSVDDSDDVADVRKVGVVKSVNAKDKTACVRWLKPVERAEDPREFDKEEVVSVYELEGHPDYDYCYGDVVVRLTPVLLPDKTDVLAHSAEDSHSPVESGHDTKKHFESENAESQPALDMATEFSDLSWVGNITGLTDGDIEVTWADGMISKVGPQAIYVVGRDDDESIAAGSDASDDAASWETLDDDNANAFDDTQGGNRNDEASDINSVVEDNNVENFPNGALSLPLAALGFMTRLASGIFSRGRKLSDTKSEDDPQADELTLSRDSNAESSSPMIDDVEYQLSKLTTKTKEEEHDVSATSDLLDIAETLCNLKSTETDAPLRDNSVSKFKGFDIVRDPIDHYFLGAQGQNIASRKWLKKVQQDWDILQNNLPEGIYVRVYEDRMDLLRAVITGPYGTPYQDGLFFFDFHLPPEYPDVPPSVYYHSGGWRINPNLYEEGKVCLSLLNTWTGRGNEVWDSVTSSILQVLVSLQGLVLNSKPYFNEAGYDKQVGTAEGEKNSLSYNENTFLLNCKTMMYLLRKPPKDFQELVLEHFRTRGYYILKACEAYMKGHLIGSLSKDASVSSDNDANSNSVGFKLMLSKMLPKLFLALSEAGADCEVFHHLIEL